MRTSPPGLFWSAILLSMANFRHKTSWHIHWRQTTQDRYRRKNVRRCWKVSSTCQKAHYTRNFSMRYSNWQRKDTDMMTCQLWQCWFFPVSLNEPSWLDTTKLWTTVSLNSFTAAIKINPPCIEQKRRNTSRIWEITSGLLVTLVTCQGWQ